MNVLSSCVALLRSRSIKVETDILPIETFVKDIQAYLDSLLTPKIIEGSDAQTALTLKLKSDLELQESEIDELLVLLQKIYKITFGANRRHTITKHDMTLECVYRSVRLQLRSL